MSNIFGHRGGRRGGGGRWRGTPWAGWGSYYPPPYYANADALFDAPTEVLVPLVFKQNADGSFEEVRDEVVGGIDIAAYQRQMNTLKQVPASVAQILVGNATNALAQASGIAALKKLPGQTTRDSVMGKLKWHQEQLAPRADLRPETMYAHGDDLKKWVLAAFVECNAVEEGTSWVDGAWGRMWSEIGAALARLPVAVAAKVNETAGALFGIPLWAMALGALGVAGVAYTVGPTLVSLIKGKK